MKGKRAFGRNSRGVYAVGFADMIRTLGRSSAVILLPVYFLTERHADYLLIGDIIAASYLVTVPLGIIGGALSDRVGRRPLFTVMPFLSALGFAMMGLEIFSNAPLTIIFLTFICATPIGNLQQTVDSAVLSDLTLPSERTRAFSILRLASNVGFSLGPALGGFVALFGYGVLMLIPAAGNIIEGIIYIMFVRETLPEKGVTSTAIPSLRKALIAFPSSDRPFLIIIGVMVVAQLCLGQWGTTLTLFLSSSYRLSPAQIGLMYSLNGVVVVLFQLPVSRLMNRFAELNRLIIGVALYAVSFFMFGLFSAYPMILTAAAILTMGENIYSPTGSTLISKMAPQNRRGEYFGAYSAIGAFAAPVIVLFGSVLLTVFSRTPVVLWGIVAALGFTACLMLWKVRDVIPAERLSDEVFVERAD